MKRSDVVARSSQDHLVNYTLVLIHIGTAIPVRLCETEHVPACPLHEYFVTAQDTFYSTCGLSSTATIHISPHFFTIG
jgi:hypothetical protein